MGPGNLRAMLQFLNVIVTKATGNVTCEFCSNITLREITWDETFHDHEMLNLDGKPYISLNNIISLALQPELSITINNFTISESGGL